MNFQHLDTRQDIFYVHNHLIYSSLVTSLVCSALLKALSKKAKEDQGPFVFHDLEKHAK